MATAERKEVLKQTALARARQRLEAIRARKAEHDTNLETFAADCLIIRPKTGGETLLRFNAVQRLVHDRLEAQKRDTGRVRALILKARQPGISTYVESRYYWRVSRSPGLYAFILTHSQEATDALFHMTDRFHRNNPEAPHTGASNAKELSFDILDSGFAVGTAGTKQVGRGRTIQFLHGSEVAYWANAQQHMAGVLQAVPNAPGTEIILESTANGVGGLFYAMCLAALRGEGAYQLIFVPWFHHGEYEAPPPDGWEPPPDFMAYGAPHGLTGAQLYWAWQKNGELARALTLPDDRPCWQFCQEYPATPEEAFRADRADALTISQLAALDTLPPDNIVRAADALLGDSAPSGGDCTDNSCAQKNASPEAALGRVVTPRMTAGITAAVFATAEFTATRTIDGFPWGSPGECEVLMTDYFVRQDGTAPNKESATDPTSASTSMSIAVANAESYVAGDFVRFSSRGGNITTAFLASSSGTPGLPVTYGAEPGFEPSFVGSISNVTPVEAISKQFINFDDLNITGDGATIDGIQIRGISSNVVLNRLTVNGVGNQCYQFEDTTQATMNDCATTSAPVQAISGHDSVKVTINGGSFTNCQQGLTYINEAQFTLNNGVVLTGHSLHAIRTTQGTGALPVLTINQATVDGMLDLESGAAIIRRLTHDEVDGNHCIDTNGLATLDLASSVIRQSTLNKFCLTVRAGCTATVSHVTFLGASQVGKAVFNAGSVTMRNYIIKDSQQAYFDSLGTEDFDYGGVFNDGDLTNYPTVANALTTDPDFVDQPNLNVRPRNPDYLGFGVTGLGVAADLDGKPFAVPPTIGAVEARSLSSRGFLRNVGDMMG